MWAIVGVLLGFMLLAVLAGFHFGPHTHFAAVAFGLAAAAWLISKAISPVAGPLVWTVVGGDIVLSAGVAALAWKGLGSRSAHSMHGASRLEGAIGIAETPLDPDGLVNVGGETWSATSVNGYCSTGVHVQVIHEGVRLEVWCEDLDPRLPPPIAVDQVTRAGQAEPNRTDRRGGP